MATRPIPCPNCGHELRPQKLRCRRCGRRWQALVPPARCPGCDSPYWQHKRGTLRRGRPPKSMQE